MYAFPEQLAKVLFCTGVDLFRAQNNWFYCGNNHIQPQNVTPMLRHQHSLVWYDVVSCCCKAEEHGCFDRTVQIKHCASRAIAKQQQDVHVVLMFAGG